MSIKLGNAEVNAISIIEPYSIGDLGGTDYSVGNLEPDWVRPSEWMDMPVINSGDNKVAMLIAVESGVLNKDIGFFLRGAQSNSPSYATHSIIDWGDGSSDLVYFEGQPVDYYYHSYNFDDLPENTEFLFDGKLARQVIIQIDSSASGLDYLNLTRSNGAYYNGRDVHSSNGQSSNILDLYIDAPDLKVIYNGGSQQKHLERMHVNCDSISNITLFKNLPSLKVAHISSGATAGLSSLQEFFFGCSKLQQAPFIDTSSATKLRGVFQGCHSIKTIPNLDTSSCTDFSTMFWECRSLEYIPDFDYSKATTLSHTFGNMHNLKAVPHGLRWPTGTYDFYNGFYNNKEMVYVASDMNTSGITSLSQSFRECTSLKKIPEIYCPNATTMFYAFYNCDSLKKIHLKDISSVTDMTYSMSNCDELREVTGENLPTGVTTFFTTFYQSSKLLKAPEFYTGNATNLNHMYGNCDELEYAQTIDASNATSIYAIFQGCRKIKDARFINVNTKITDARYAFDACESLKSIPSGLFVDYNSCPSRADLMFNRCSSLREVNNIVLSGCIQSNNISPFRNSPEGLDIRKFGNIEFGSGVYLDWLIHNNDKVTSVPDWDFSGVESLHGAFWDCNGLAWSDVKNTKTTIHYYNCLLGSGAIENIFNNLASGVVGQSIDIRDNYGVSELHPDTIAIATSKGWTVTT